MCKVMYFFVIAFVHLVSVPTLPCNVYMSPVMIALLCKCSVNCARKYFTEVCELPHLFHTIHSFIVRIPNYAYFSLPGYRTYHFRYAVNWFSSYEADQDRMFCVMIYSSMIVFSNYHGG